MREKPGEGKKVQKSIYISINYVLVDFLNVEPLLPFFKDHIVSIREIGTF